MPMTYRDAVEQLGMAIFEDLNRPSDDDIAALANRLGFSLTEDGVKGVSANMQDAPTRACFQLLRAAYTAREAKRKSHDYGDNA